MDPCRVTKTNSFLHKMLSPSVYARWQWSFKTPIFAQVATFVHHYGETRHPSIIYYVGETLYIDFYIESKENIVKS